MRHRALDYARAYLAAASQAGESDWPAIARRLVNLVRRRKQDRLFNKIVRNVERLWQERQGIVAYRLTTARPVDEAMIQHIVDSKGQYTLIHDDRMIGGAIIERGDERIDASIRGYLSHLGSELKKPS